MRIFRRKYQPFNSCDFILVQGPTVEETVFCNAPVENPQPTPMGLYCNKHLHEIEI